MSDLHVKYLLIGGGLASSAAAQAIRSADPEGSVLLVGQEINRPYRRTALTGDYLMRRVTRDSLFTLAPTWFEQNRVELRTGRRVSHLDTGRQAATLDNGEEVSFDTALLATGALPRALDVPGARLPNLFYLRAVEDADRILNAVEKARREGRAHERGRGRVVVIGGGAMGVQLSVTFSKLDLAVDLLVAHDRPWHRFAGETAGRMVAAHLQKRGVTVHLNAPALRLEGDGRVQRAVLGSGQSIPCDFAVAAVGALANKELLRGTPIAAGKSILVDEHCRTNVHNVYAAGDCAAVFDSRFGKHRGQAQWDEAEYTGTLAGTNMAGVARRYDSVGEFTSDVFDLPARGWGEARLVDRRIVRGAPGGVAAGTDAPQVIEFGVAADGRIAHVLALGSTSDHEVLRRLVAERTRIDGNEEAFKEPTSPFADLL
jgi:3-phenylpropionate/trans-cinnamate dioxygenase ferredoxin reductase subunit